MAADIYTKAFTDQAKWKWAYEPINVVDGSQIDILINHNSLNHKEKQAVSDAKAKIDEKALLKAMHLLPNQPAPDGGIL